MVTRTTQQNRRFTRFFVGIFLLVALFFGIRSLGRMPSMTRQSIVVIGDPVVIVSWETTRPQFTLLVVPKTLTIEATHGYGAYSVGSLWNLDMMEKRNGSLFLSSLSENFALPIQWYITADRPIGETKERVVQDVSSVFSLSSFISSLCTRRTTVSLVEAFRLWRYLSHIGADTTNVFDFRMVDIAYEDTQPDGSKIEKLDPQKYDVVIGDALEDVALRQERMRLAVYNTTTTPGLGERLGRALGAIGGFVVFVGNDDVLYDGICEVQGTKERLRSITGQFITTLYRCVTKETNEPLRGDMIIRLGKQFENRYLPF